jgi:ABC transport system ATP-binding/permease protein
MNYLQLENVSTTFGEKVLFRNINLLINKGDKIGLIAKNGSGKTTLLNVIAGNISPEGENAKILINKNIKIVFLDQEPDLDKNSTIIDAIFQTEDPKLNAIKKYEESLLIEDESKLQSTIVAIDNLKAWDFENKIKEILFKLKIPDLNKSIKELSGGQEKRVALAKIILQEPDFLILDEPTNHLDIDMIEWLEDYLSSKNLTLLMVTHDRYFLENTCNRIIELDNGSLNTYSGNYEDYLTKKAEKSINDNITAEKLNKLLKKELEWLNRQPKARTTKSKSRTDNFFDLKEKAAKQIYNDTISIDIDTQRLGSKILELYNVNKSFGEIKIIEDFTYKFKRFEKIGMVGDNGTGKTTIINLLTGQIKQDAGRIIIGETVKFGVFSQTGLELNNDKRVLDVILEIAEYLPMANGRKLTAEQLLERFLFQRPQQQVYVSQLSGGEKRRLQLLTVLMSNPNFLILDEPTNDLDIITLNILEEYLIGFKGNLIVVTHDRYFLDKIVDQTFVLTGNGQIKAINTRYTEYRQTNEKQPTKENKTNIETPDKNKIRDEKRKLNNEISKTMKEIELKEMAKKAILDFFNENTDNDIVVINEKSKNLESLNVEILDLETKWTVLMDKIDQLESKT